MLLTRSPLSLHRNEAHVRLACIRHAASVHPEPGSNSPYCTKCVQHPLQNAVISLLVVLSHCFASYHSAVVKVLLTGQWALGQKTPCVTHTPGGAQTDRKIVLSACLSGRLPPFASSSLLERASHSFALLCSCRACQHLTTPLWGRQGVIRRDSQKSHRNPTLTPV